MRRFVVALLAVFLVGAMATMVSRQVVQAQVAATPGTDATGTLTGKVVDSSGNPVSGAIVRVMRIPNNGPRRRGRVQPNKAQPGQTVWIKHMLVVGITKTADDGTFTVNNAPIGKYRVVAFDRGIGFGHINKPVPVAVGAVADAGTITLRKGRPGRHGRPGPPPGR